MHDIQKSLTVLGRDERLAPLIKKFGFPVPKPKRNSFKSLTRSIIRQQISGKAADSIQARFLELFPRKKFPTSKEVVQMPISKLRSAGLSGQKASYIKDLAEKFSNGTVKHRALHKMKTEEVIAHLTQIKGIGVWTVHMFLISALNRPDVLPTGDLGIRKGFQIVYRLKTLPGHAKMERLAKPWRAHASLASWYLWRVADEAKVIRK